MLAAELVRKRKSVATMLILLHHPALYKCADEWGTGGNGWERVAKGGRETKSA